MLCNVGESLELLESLESSRVSKNNHQEETNGKKPQINYFFIKFYIVVPLNMLLGVLNELSTKKSFT